MIIDVLLTILWIVLGVVALALLIPALIFVFAWVCALFIDTNKTHKDNGFFRWLLSVLALIVVKFARVKVHVSGEEKLPKEQKYLLICNHRSGFDPIIKVWCFRKQKLGFISKKENFKVPVLGGIGAKCTFLSIDRQDPKSSLKTIIYASQLIKSQSRSIGVYPEGTRSHGAELLPFHDAIFKIATKAACPIAVCSISGTEKITKTFIFKTKHVYLDVIEIMPAEKVEGARTTELGEYCKNLIAEKLSTRD